MFPLHKTVFDCLSVVIVPKMELIPKTDLLRVRSCEIVFDNLPTELFCNCTMLKSLCSALRSYENRLKKYTAVCFADSIVVDSPDVPCFRKSVVIGDIPFSEMRTMVRLDSTVRFTLRISAPLQYVAKVYEISLDVINKSYKEYRKYINDFEQLSVLF